MIDPLSPGVYNMMTMQPNGRHALLQLVLLVLYLLLLLRQSSNGTQGVVGIGCIGWLTKHILYARAL